MIDGGLKGWQQAGPLAAIFFFREASFKVAVNLLHKHRARVFKNFLAF